MRLTEEQINKQLENLKGWELKDDALYLFLKFKDFKDAFAAMTRIAFEVERFDHHPDWSNTYNKLEISLTTHEEGGVTEKDIELAKVISEVVRH